MPSVKKSATSLCNPVENPVFFNRSCDRHAKIYLSTSSWPAVSDYTRTPTSPNVVLSNDVADCRQSLSDIRDRIGSLQSLLQTSRALTGSSRTMLLADRPTFNLPPPKPIHHPLQPPADAPAPPSDVVTPAPLAATLSDRPTVGIQPLGDNRPVFSIQPPGGQVSQPANQSR